MGRFAGIKNAKFNPGGVYFEPVKLPLGPNETEKDRKFATGEYLVRIDTVKVTQSRPPKKTDNFIVDTTILESNVDERRPGSACTWMTTSDKDAYLGNVNHFVSVATDTPESDIDEEGVEMVVADKNPLKGSLIRLSANRIWIGDKKDKEFTKIIFRPATEADLKKYASPPPAEEEKKTA